MNKLSENKPSLQDQPNKLVPANDALNEQDLTKVSGGVKRREQDQPGNEMAH